MQRIKDFWNKNNTSKIILIIGGLIIFCCTCSIFISFLPGSESAPVLGADAIYTEAAQTVIAEYTQVAVVTDTPAPTNTPVPPQATATNVQASENALYIQEITPIIDLCAEALGNISDLSFSAGSDISKLYDDNWILAMATSLAALQLSADMIKEISPPPDMIPTHAWVLKAAEEIYPMVDSMTYGIDNLDSNSFAKATQHTVLISEYMGMATEEIQKVSQ